MVKVASERDAEGVARILKRSGMERRKERKKEKIERIKKYIVT
jgi:hypothetical protein